MHTHHAWVFLEKILSLDFFLMKNLGWVVTREEAKTTAGARVHARLEAKKGKGEKGGVAACCLSLRP